MQFSSNAFWKSIGCLVSDPTFGIGGSSLCDKGESIKISENKRKKYIVILACKTYVHAILVGLGEGKELTATLTGICTPEIWKAQYGVTGIYPLSSMSLQDHRRTRYEI